MGAPEIILIILYALSLYLNLEKWGKGEISGSSFAGCVASTAVQFGLLAWGGFFS